jgi:hypothetical protein
MPDAIRRMRANRELFTPPNNFRAPTLELGACPGSRMSIFVLAKRLLLYDAEQSMRHIEAINAWLAPLYPLSGYSLTR